MTTSGSACLTLFDSYFVVFVHFFYHMSSGVKSPDFDELRPSWLVIPLGPWQMKSVHYLKLNRILPPPLLSSNCDIHLFTLYNP